MGADWFNFYSNYKLLVGQISALDINLVGEQTPSYCPGKGSLRVLPQKVLHGVGVVEYRATLQELLLITFSLCPTSVVSNSLLQSCLC